MIFTPANEAQEQNQDLIQEQPIYQSHVQETDLAPLEINYQIQDFQRLGKRTIVHSRLPSTSNKEQREKADMVLHIGRKNLCFEIEYLRDLIEGKEVHWSISFDQFCRDIQTDRKISTMVATTLVKSMDLNEHENPFYTVEEEFKKTFKVKGGEGGLKKEYNSLIVEFIQRMFIVLQGMRKECLGEGIAFEKQKTEKALFVLSCYLERIRLYLDDCIYPRDHALNILDVDIDIGGIKKQNMHFSDRQCSIYKVDFFTAFTYIRRINEKIKKMETKEVEEMNKVQLGNKTSLQLSTQVGQDFQNFGGESLINLSEKDIEEIKKQLRNSTGLIPKHEKFWKLIDFFSPSLLRIHDQNELLSKEVNLVVKIENCNLRNFEINMILYSEPLTAISNQALVEPCRFFENGYQIFVFQNISFKHVIANNLVLLMNAVETKVSRTPSQTKELLQTTAQYSQLKNQKGYTLLPLTKLFWSQTIQNGVSQELVAKFYRTSSSFRIEERYVQLLEKNQLSKYKDQYLSSQLELKYSFHLTTRVSNEELKEATIIKKVNFDIKENIARDKDYIGKIIRKEEYRFNDIKVNLSKLILNDKVCKSSPAVRIELSLRDNYGLVYDTVYLSVCENQFSFTQTYESLIYPTAPDIAILEGLFIRIPTKSLETLKKLYIIFFVQTLTQGSKDSKGNKIKSKTFANELENLQFRTELFGVIPLYDQKKDLESILKNMTYQITLRHMNVEKFKNFKKHEQIVNFDLCNDSYLRIGVNVISNEFTHNKLINNLMLLNEKNALFSQYEIILNDLKHIESEELIYFHDKILDKLFQLITFSKNATTQDLIFETIIQIIQVFYTQYKDYKQLLNNYLQSHFAHSKAYIPLLHQVRQTAEIVRQGFKAENEFQNEDTLLSTMKYLSIILRLMRLSFQEEQQCMKQIGSESSSPTKSAQDSPEKVGDQEQHYILGLTQMPARVKFDAYLNLKNSMIEEQEDEEEENNGKSGVASKNLEASINQYQEGVIKKSLMRKKDIRQTIKNEGLVGKVELTKTDYIILLQRSVHSIFEGCHKDSMKSTLSLRAILYENIVEILDQITEFIDDKFFIRIMSFIFEEPIYNFNAAVNQIRRRAQNSEVQKSIRPMNSSFNTTRPDNRRSELIEDYVTKKNFLEGLKDYSFINEEYITKQKIIAMGNILSGGILDKVSGNSNRVVQSFCDHIEQIHIKKPEYSTYVFYFLHQLFIYLNPKHYQEIWGEESAKEQKPKPANYKPLDLSGFFTKILPELSSYLRKYFKENNAQLRVKEDKHLENALAPFYEKTSLILMSVANEVTKERMKDYLLHDHDRLHMLIDNLKKLLKRITFQKPYHNYFEKKKIQVIRKVNDFTLGLLMDSFGDNIQPDYHKIISVCRIVFLIVSCKQSQIKLEYQRTVRANALVKDQLPLKKTLMFHNFKLFWSKFRHIGQPWTQLQCLTKDFSLLMKQGFQKPMMRFMGTFSEIAEQEYQQTSQISYSSNCIFNIYNELLQSTEGEYEANQTNFYSFFEKCIKGTETFKSNAGFQKIVDIILEQMKKLGESMKEVNNCKRNPQKNAFYETYCQALLMDLLWELKLFKLFNQNKQSFKNLHQNLGAFTEQAFTDLRFLQIIQNSEDLQMQIGQREIAAMVQIDLMKDIADNLQKADMFEKAIEILGQMKELCENVLFDYDKVSKVLVEQSRIYKQLAEKPNRNYCVYFKVGFFGQTFPEYLRNSYFIYRGIKLATRPDILSDMKKYFPDMQMLNNTTTPPKEVFEGQQQYFQIEVVQALTYKEMIEFNLDETTKDKEEMEQAHKLQYIPDKYKVYYKENFKNKFYKETVLKKNMDDDMQSDILIEVFKVKDKFPTIFKMQQIINTKNIVLNAIDKATIIVSQMNEKITQCGQAINQLQNSQMASNQNETSGLQMNVDKLQALIRGTLESPISGGIKRIIHTFINEEYLISTEKAKVQQLFGRIQEHSQVLNDAIHQFSQVNDDDRIVTKLDKDYLQFKGEIDEIKQFVDEVTCRNSSLESFAS